MIKRVLNYIGFISFMLIVSCEYNYIDTSGVLPDQVSYSEHIEPVFKNNCTDCHNNQSVPPVLLRGQSHNSIITGKYVDTNQPGKSTLLKKINSGHPTVDVPTSFEKQLIEQWITEGALNN